ncbi:MAG: DNA translocase FtsK [Lachnospiraceae bacterium]|nr:DNA translocase FtsK [Lachnospiraceae bacterium]
MAYIIPIGGLAYIGYTKLVNTKPVLPAFKISAGSGLVILGTLLSFFAKLSFADLMLMTEGRWKALYEAGEGGGAFFGMIGLLFYKIFGKGGSIAILILLLFVCLVFMLGDNIFIIADAIRTRIEYFREGVENYEGFTESEEDKEERHERRERREKRNREMFMDRMERRKEHARIREEEKAALLEKKKAEAEQSEIARKEEAAKKEEAARTAHEEELRKREQAQDEAILSRNSKRDTSVRRIPASAQSSTGRLDDLHEITVIADPIGLSQGALSVSPISDSLSAISSVSGRMKEITPEGGFSEDGINPVTAKSDQPGLRSMSELSAKPDTPEKDISEFSGSQQVMSEIRINKQGYGTDANRVKAVVGEAAKPEIIETETIKAEAVGTDKSGIDTSKNDIADTSERSGKTTVSETDSSAGDGEDNKGDIIPEVKVSGGSNVKAAEADTVSVSSSAIDITGLDNMPAPVTERTHAAQKAASPEENNDQTPARKRSVDYERPPVNLLKANEKRSGGDSDENLKKTALLLQETLNDFKVEAKVTDISQGPSVTRFELQLKTGTKVNKIVSLNDDLKLSLAAQDIRIEAPIPGKAAVGIEIPNKEKIPVLMRELIDSDEFRASKANLTYVLGRDITGKTIVSDIAKMPHLLIAGSTGSGKSVFINTLIMSLLYKSSPDDVKLIMIDPKVVELSVYNGIPHLLLPVVSDPKQATAALNWAVAEMMNRYKAFSEHTVRDIRGYNEKSRANHVEKMPQIVIIVDELADLMMVASKDVEAAICRLAQLARAAGIHLVIATQRPSVDVITGLIKANMPSRIAFKVSSGVDSRTILDTTGAERLLGNGDMLFHPQSFNKPLRVQGAFVSDDEVMKVVEFLKKNAGADVYDKELADQITKMSGSGDQGDDSSGGGSISDEYDTYFADACRFVVEKQKASSSMLQRVFKIGYNRAARMVDQMEGAGVVGPEEGSSPRKVLMDSLQLDEFLKSINLG